ncbi:MAG: bifunctional phosphoribosylaminoimidazolecarboxamide formyltransferase/IMP cyclohydrolase [Christensenellales bacterium]|jgi:phosphoribosylaminoimidazolecarboxamide formyltransferase/IMP cyclohydrolase
MKRALISVSDKQGIVELARQLLALGYEILSTGGTAAALEDSGIPVTAVSEVTGFPECLDGRVKTLHPAIHGGLLAMRDNPEHMRQIGELGIEPIDVVVINLYPFRQTISRPGASMEEAVENIDIGGPSMLRAAAKNWQDVAVMVDPADYEEVLRQLKETGGVDEATRLRLCYKVFEHTAGYDALVAGYLRPRAGVGFPAVYTPAFEKQQDLRYGENPHQSAVFYRELLDVRGTLAAAEQLHGKELSYNNIADTNGALECLREFEGEVAVVAVKHANPCGVGVGETVYEAWRKCYEADPVSIFGGIIVTNAAMDEKTAEEVGKIFVEIVLAPAFTDGALAILKKKKNIRLLRLEDINAPLPQDSWDYKRVAGGLLVQQRDLDFLSGIQVVTDRAPTEREMDDLMFAWKVVKHVKSNGIAVAKDGQSLGIGPGQVNRIWPTQQAIERSGEKVRGAALASDAYFPFDDCVKEAARAGITAIIQPGGSVNDKDSIKACNDAGIAMVFTGMRHFKHS